MKHPKKIILLGAVLLLSGCTDFFMICSLNPFYLEKNITLFPAIEGRWNANALKSRLLKEDTEVWKQMDTTAVWKIERRIAKESIKTSHGTDSVTYRALDYYQVWLIHAKPDTTIYQFKLVLFKVNQSLYGDFMPVGNTDLEKSRFASESYFKIHTLARLNIRDNQLVVSWLGANYMKEMIEKKRVRVSYRWVSDASRLLLTGSSEQLTGMLERYGSETRFIDWENQQAMLKLNRIN